MVNYAKQKDLLEIKKIWDTCFNEDDYGYNNYYFNYQFNPEETLVISEDDRIVSIGTRRNHIYMLNERPIKSSFIFGIATLERYRNKGYMKQILNMHLDHAVHQELFTFIKAYKEDAYSKFGFVPIYYNYRYMLYKSDLKYYDMSDTRHGAKSKDLFEIYSNNMKKFNGFMIRDEKYFDDLITSVRYQNGDVITTYDANGKIKGYAVFYRRQNYVVITEIMYIDVPSLIRLLTSAISIRGKVELHTTVYENIQSLFENVTPVKYPSVYVRINDYELFNKVFNLNVDNVKDAFNAFGKPLYLNEDI